MEMVGTAVAVGGGATLGAYAQINRSNSLGGSSNPRLALKVSAAVGLVAGAAAYFATDFLRDEGMNRFAAAGIAAVPLAAGMLVGGHQWLKRASVVRCGAKDRRQGVADGDSPGIRRATDNSFESATMPRSDNFLHGDGAMR
jgi:hypothetical protein